MGFLVKTKIKAKMKIQKLFECVNFMILLRGTLLFMSDIIAFEVFVTQRF